MARDVVRHYSYVRVRHEADVHHSQRIRPHVHDLKVDADKVIGALARPLVALLYHLEPQARVLVTVVDARERLVDLVLVCVVVLRPEHLLRDGREVLVDQPVVVVVETIERILVVPLERLAGVEDVIPAVFVVVVLPEATGSALPRLVDGCQRVLKVRRELLYSPRHRDAGRDQRVGVALVTGQSPDPQARRVKVLVAAPRRPLRRRCEDVRVGVTEVAEVGDVQEKLADAVIPPGERHSPAVRDGWEIATRPSLRQSGPSVGRPNYEQRTVRKGRATYDHRCEKAPRSSGNATAPCPLPAARHDSRPGGPRCMWSAPDGA